MGIRQLPPNRVVTSPARALLAFCFVLTIGAIAYVRGSNPPHHPEAQQASTHLAPAVDGPGRYKSTAWLIAVCGYAAWAVGLVALRRTLPQKYKTWELREVPSAPTPVAQSRDPVPIDRRYRGTIGIRRGVLTLDDSGLHWHSPAQLMRSEQLLDIGWKELKHLQTGRRVSSWLLTPALIGMVVAVKNDHMVVSVTGVAVGLLLVAAAVRFRTATLFVLTPTHQLTFTSSEIKDGDAALIKEALETRSPPSTMRPKGTSLWKALFIEPFERVFEAFEDNDAIRMKHLRVLELSANDEEQVIVSAIQFRLWGLWFGGLVGPGPLLVALSAGLACWSILYALAGYVIGLVAGAFVVSKAGVWFVRFSGMHMATSRS